MAGPVFIGGTGRCGTHVVASLAGWSGRNAVVPGELRLHISPEGLGGYADGTRSRDHLLRGLRTHWWRHRPEWDPSQLRGIHRIVPEGRYRAAVARLAAAPPEADHIALSRRLVSSLLDPLAPAPGAWVEKSPDNCAAGGHLHRLFPELRLIHVIRDGRDVACSFMRVPWAPDDFESAFNVWERGVLDAERGAREVPPEQVHRLALEDLASGDGDGDRAYRELLRFLGIPDEPRLRARFKREVTAARARPGRWRFDLHPAQHAWAESLYRESLERLAAAGVGSLPSADSPEIRQETGAGAEPETESRLDPWAGETARAVGSPEPSF